MYVIELTIGLPLCIPRLMTLAEADQILCRRRGEKICQLQAAVDQKSLGRLELIWHMTSVLQQTN